MRSRYHLTPSFVLFSGLTLLVGAAAVSSQFNLLFWVFGIMLSGIGLSVLVTWLMVLGVEVKRLPPAHGAVGEPLIVQYQLRNRWRFIPIFNVHIEELPVVPVVTRRRWWRRRQRSGDAHENEQPPGMTWERRMPPARSWVMHCAPRETVHAEAVFWPRSRGPVRFERFRIRTSFPFGILQRSMMVHQPQGTLIFPLLYRVKRHIVQSLTPSGPLGTRVTQRAGPGDDYFGVREYRHGDSVRHISWRLTARMDQLITIERSHPSPPRLRIALNLLTPTERLRLKENDWEEKRRAEERAISLAGSLIHAADAEGYQVGLTVFGADVPSIPVRRSRWHVGRMLAALASIELDQPRLPRERAGLSEIERAGLVVVHPDRTDPTLGREAAWHVTGGQLETLTDEVLGWDPGTVRYAMDSAEAREWRVAVDEQPSIAEPVNARRAG